MRAGLLRARTVVVPSVGAAEIVIEVVIVYAAVKSVRASLGYHLYLAARATSEVRRLVRRRNLKLFNTSDRDGNNGRRCLAVPGTVIGAYSSGGVATKALDISVVVAAHVIGGIAPIKLERVLVRSCTADVAIEVLARLKDGQGRCVAATVRQVHERLAAEVGADGGVHGLQLSAYRYGNLDDLRNGAQLEYGVQGQLEADLHHLV